MQPLLDYARAITIGKQLEQKDLDVEFIQKNVWLVMIAIVSGVLFIWPLDCQADDALQRDWRGSRQCC